MPYSLNFAFRRHYDTAQQGIGVPVELRFGEKAVELTAMLDTGASYCIFQRTYGESLGLVIENGIPESFGLANGNQFRAYGHEVTLTAINIEVDGIVYFADDNSIRRSVLGRQGWMDKLRLGLVHYDGYLYLSKYDDEP